MYNSTQQQNLDIDHYIYGIGSAVSNKLKTTLSGFLFFFLGVFFMFPTMSYSTSLSGDAAIVSSVGTTRLVHDFASLNPLVSSFSPPHSQSHHQQQQQNKIRKKRSLPGHPEADAEVIALSPTSLLATNRFVCDLCNRGFRRDQNLQLHKRGHNLPWKLKQRSAKDVKKKAYVCPEPSCVHHHPSRALGDLTGIKKHYSRKHGEKKWKCQKCSKIYAVQSDWKAHSKTCGTREYRCDCGTLFSRKGSFITHRAFCEALAEESARLSAAAAATNNPNYHHCHQLDDQQPYNSHIFANTFTPQNDFSSSLSLTNSLDPPPQNPNITITSTTQNLFQNKPDQKNQNQHIPPMITSPLPVHNQSQNLHMTSTQPVSSSVTEPLQQAATVTTVQQPQYLVGHVAATRDLDAEATNNIGQVGFGTRRVLLGHVSPQFLGMSTWKKSDGLTRDFLGLSTRDNHIGTIGNGKNQGSTVDVSMNVMDMLNFTGGMEFRPYEHDHSVLLNLKLRARGQGYYGFTEHPSGTWG